MKKFEVPQISVMRFNSENVFTGNGSPQCDIAALGCASCYCVAVDCDDTYVITTPVEDPECPTYW